MGVSWTYCPAAGRKKRKGWRGEEKKNKKAGQSDDPVEPAAPSRWPPQRGRGIA